MSKTDKIIIIILLKICEILARYSDKMTTTDLFTLRKLFEEEK